MQWNFKRCREEKSDHSAHTVTFILPSLLTHLSMNQLSHCAFVFLMQVRGAAAAAAGGELQALDRKGLHLKKL